MSVLLSERPKKRYIVVVERYNDNVKRPITETHIVEAANLPEAVILAEPILAANNLIGHSAQLLSVRETTIYPQSFMEANELNMIEVLKDLAGHHPDFISNIDEIAEGFKSYNDNPYFSDTVHTVINMLLMVPSIEYIDCSVTHTESDNDYVMIEHYCQSLSNLYLSRGTELRRLTNNRSAEGASGLAALVCGIRDMLAQLV